MNHRFVRFALLATVAISTAISTSHAFAQMSPGSESGKIPSTYIPINRTAQPASDLVYEGKLLDPGAAFDLSKKGLDLSQLDPSDSDLWSQQKKSLVSTPLIPFPAEGSELNFEEFVDRYDEGTNPDGSPKIIIGTKGMVRTQVSNSEGQFFRLTVSFEHHSALMRAALMRSLGYASQSPRYYRNLKLKFPSMEARSIFLQAIESVLAADSSRGWIREKPEGKPYLVVGDVVIEDSKIEVSPYHWSRMSGSHVKGRRVLRGLVVPFVLVDIPETQNVNIFSWQAASIMSEHLVMYNTSASAFGDTSIDDVKWSLRKTAFLTREDWKKIVAESQYPSDIQALVLEKVIARRNNMVLVTGLAKDLPANIRELPINNQVTVGGVVAGRATREKYEGYASRFTFGNPESPLTRSEILKWLKIEGYGNILGQFIKTLNDKLVINQVSDLALARQEENLKNYFTHLITKPGEPYHQSIGVWGGPVGSLNINASRNLVSGTYYGNDKNQIQLVDQISVGATAGYFLGVDGIKNVIPSLSGNVQVTRTYVHVRPVMTVTAADKESWKKLWIPGFMKNTAAILGTEGAVYSGDDEISELKKKYQKFLDELADGEIFSITDSIGAGLRGTVNLPVTALLGLDVALSNSFSVSLNTKAVMLRRVTFSRDNGYIKVYISSVKSGSVGGALDANFWMSIATLSRDFKKGQATTRAYHMAEKYETDDELKKQVNVIKFALMSEDTSYLEDNYQPYTLDHRLTNDVTKGKFLFWRWTWYEEKHKVKIRPPIPPEQADLKAKDFERTLVSHRYLRRAGKNYYSFLSDIIDGAIGYAKVEWLKPGVLTTNAGDDPAASFLGTSKTYSIQTEDETTPGKASAPITISRTAWSGWILSKEKVFAVLDLIEARLKTLSIQGELVSTTVSPEKGETSQSLKGKLFIIDRNVFNDMKQLQFYEISSSWIVRKEGLSKLVRFVVGKPGDRPGFVERIGGEDIYSDSDHVIIAGLANLLGGKDVFEKACKVQELNRRGTSPSFPTNIAYGKTYPCILPWMHPILTARRSYSKKTSEERVEWINEIVKNLESNIPLKNLMEYLGAENFFFQVRVSGFRTGDELIEDKTMGETIYVSSSIGTIGRGGSSGVFSDFAEATNISENEIYARYLGEGF